MLSIDCIHCEIAWTEWTLCEDGGRTRNEYIVVDALGVGSPCPDQLEEEFEGFCVDSLN